MAAHVSIVLAGPATPALDLLVARAQAGAEEAGGAVHRVRVEEADPEALTAAALDGAGLLLAFPALLYGLPGTLKAWLDGWLPALAAGRLVPRTAHMRAGYLCVHAPDEPLIPELVHRHLRAVFAHLAMDFVGKAGGFTPPGAAGPGDPGQAEVARRLGAALAGADTEVGYPPEYLAGIARYNAGEFWEAHEEWEELWLESDGDRRAFHQGLIQVAAAFHHLGRENWGGMSALLRDGTAKLARYRPRTLGLDVDDFLARLEPWRLWAEARAGRGGPVTRRPGDVPRIELAPEGAAGDAR